MLAGRTILRLTWAAALAAALAVPAFAGRVVVPPGVEDVQAIIDRSIDGDVIVLEGEHRGPVRIERTHHARGRRRRGPDGA